MYPGIAELVLNYPESCNALTGRMVVDLDLAVEDLYSWDTGKALLIRGMHHIVVVVYHVYIVGFGHGELLHI